MIKLFQQNNKPKIYRVKSGYKKTRQARSRLLYFLYSIALASFAFLLFSIYSSGLLIIKNIEINPENSKFNQEITNLSNKYINNNQKISFLFDYDDLRDNLERSFPKLKFKKVERSGLDAVLIDFERKIPLAKYCISNKSTSECVFLDDYGDEMEVDDLSKNSYVLLIDDERLDSDINKILDILRSIDIEIKKLNINPSSYFLPKEGLPSINIYTKNGPIILMAPENIKEQISTLDKALRTRIDSGTVSKLKYIDLRVADRVYYK